LLFFVGWRGADAAPRLVQKQRLFTLATGIDRSVNTLLVLPGKTVRIDGPSVFAGLVGALR